MRYLKILVFVLAFLLIPVTNTHASSSNYVNVVNPIRGDDFWEEQFDTTTTLKGEIEVLTNFNIPATWLIRPDVFESRKLIELIRTLPESHEKGVFLEVTPTWTKKAAVSYRKSQSWHFAESIFLTGYEQSERIKLIDAAFENFRSLFGYYPKSVGAWWIDSFSLDYMQSKYGINAALIVADQYTTDNYQIWGQYWSAPYYPAKMNALFPAQSKEEKIPVVMMQWAPRDPVNGYGKGVEESTLSVQPNDYIDFHYLDINYFTKLVDIYTTQKLNSFSQIVIGLENSYSWQKYQEEYVSQMQVLINKQKSGQLVLRTMDKFAIWYKTSFKEISPAQIIIADDPLKSNKKVIWFMNPFYRAGLFINNDKVLFRDIRQYIAGSKEMCFDVVCKSINFASNATRVLDEVTNGNNLILDEGKIFGFNVFKKGDKYIVEYMNQTGKKRMIEFLPRDIGVDGQISSIDSTILRALEANKVAEKSLETTKEDYVSGVVFKEVVQNTAKFLLFILVAILIPGFVILRKIILGKEFFLQIFLSACLGTVVLTLLTFFSRFLGFDWLVWIYPLLMLVFFVIKKVYRDVNFAFRNISLKQLENNKSNILIGFLILVGTIFQVIPTFASGTMTKYGLGFWGPNAHDGLWHISLVNQLIKKVPPENPVFAGENLSNYHYFYDLLVAQTHKLTLIPASDLIFRFYPVILSLLLGIGTYFLAIKLFKSKLGAFFAVYLSFFAGSFGWIVEYMRVGRLSGESAFWSNQPVSFNLNPPFAVSLVLLIAVIYLLSIYLENGGKKLGLFIVLISGSLIGFKAYAAILALGALFSLAVIWLIIKRSVKFAAIVCGAVLVSLLVLVPNYQLNDLYKTSGSIFIFSPFWFVHSMVDSPDRLGWVRLSLARIVGFEQGDWFKYLSAEILGFLIFLGGNLGVRIFSLGAFAIKYKNFGNNWILVFIYLLTFYSIIIPLFYIQAGNPWNVIQFLYYGLYTTAILASVVLVSIFGNFKFLGKIIVLIILFIAPINAIATANSYIYPIPHTSLSVAEVEGLKFLSTQPNGVVLVPPFNPSLRKGAIESIPLSFYETTAYVSALSNKPTFVEDEIQQEILQTKFKERITAANYFFKINETTWAKTFLKENNIQYIYLPKILKLSLEEEKLGIKKIYTNNGADVYKVK